MLVWTVLAILAAPAFFGASRAFFAWRAGYAAAEMDWDNSGGTSLGEFLRAAEIGKRPIAVDGATCFEYFSQRDGLVVKTVCPR
jgi:hypothetical protein